jgi:lipopolysaccharide heptosyltransferase I
MTPAPERILIIRPSALGDVCRSVPVLVSLRQAFPDARIDWLVQDSYRDAVRAHPDLSGVLEFPRARLASWWRPGTVAELLRWLRELARRRYDLVLDCQGLARSGVFCLATRAKRRVGYANAAEFGWVGLTDRVSVSRRMHAVDRMLSLMEAIGVKAVRDLRLYSPPEEARAVSDDPDLGGCRFAVLAPTSRWPGKRWPADRFAAVASSLLRDGRVERVVLVGAASERQQCGPLLELASEDARVIDFIGRTTVGRLMSLVERSSLVVANDSACLHMAVGFDRPLVGLYGPTRVELVGPYQRNGDVVQRICEGDDLDHKHHTRGTSIMARISVEDVLQAVQRSLYHRSGPGSVRAVLASAASGA